MNDQGHERLEATVLEIMHRRHPGVRWSVDWEAPRPAPSGHERYISAKELAEIMGVSERTIRTWTAQGLPNERWGKRMVRFLPSQAIAWAREQAP